jgi:hypothetical protein
MYRTIHVLAALLTVACGALPTTAHAETVFVKYRGGVDLATFECTDVSRSSFIRRVCYDARNEYMLISLKGSFYHYCEIDTGTVEALLKAPSMGGFYNAHIRGSGTSGPFDCRTRRAPTYE